MNDQTDNNLRDNTRLVKQEPVTDNDVLPDGILARIKLRRPLTDQDGIQHHMLEIREPTTADYIRIGDPYRMVDGAIESNPRAGLDYLEACTGIHSVILKSEDGLHIHDMMKSVGAIVGFFAQA